MEIYLNLRWPLTIGLTNLNKGIFSEISDRNNFYILSISWNRGPKVYSWPKNVIVKPEILYLYYYLILELHFLQKQY